MAVRSRNASTPNNDGNGYPFEARTAFSHRASNNLQPETCETYSRYALGFTGVPFLITS